MVLGGSTSNICCVWCPPRISVGPIAVLIYIDRVASFVSHSNITVYADDIAMYKTISTQEQRYLVSQARLPVRIWPLQSCPLRLTSVISTTYPIVFSAQPGAIDARHNGSEAKWQRGTMAAMYPLPISCTPQHSAGPEPAILDWYGHCVHFV